MGRGDVSCGRGGWWLAAVLAALVWGGAQARAGGAALRVFGGARAYSATSSLHLSAAPAARDVAAQLRSTLLVAPLWQPPDHHDQDSDPPELLLYFDVKEASTWGRGAHARAEFMQRPSLLDDHPSLPFYAHWRSGRLHTLYLDPALPIDLRNYQRALASLFQFQLLDGEHVETDVSGECDVMYESLGEMEIRKIKRACRWASGVDTIGVESRRVVRYSLGPRGVETIHCEEVHSWRAWNATARARGWQRLELSEQTPTAPAPLAASDIAAALRLLPPRYTPHDLPLEPQEQSPLELLQEEEDLPENTERVLREAAGALSEGPEGGEDEGAGGAEGGATREHAQRAAAAVLRALPAAARASRKQFDGLLREQLQHKHNNLTGVLVLAGLAGTRGAHAAVQALLRGGARGDAPDPPDPPLDTYYHALAHALEPDEGVVLEAARSTSGAAWLAAGACGPRLASKAAGQVRDVLAQHLTKCKEDEQCLATAAAALGSLRRADAGEILLEQAERGPRHAALAALEALSAAPPAAPPAALTPARLRRVLAVTLQLHRPRSLDVRAVALDLYVTRMAETADEIGGISVPLLQLAAALRKHGPAELRRLLWRRLAELEPRSPAVSALLRQLPPSMRTWDALAMPGTSSVMGRWVSAAGGGGARLDSVQVAEGGSLRRSRVRLELPGGAAALALTAWTSGMAALEGGGGGGSGGGGGDEDVAAGLGAQLGAAHQRPLTLFSSQAQLLGHVWAGTGSTPTPVMRGAVPLARGGARLALGGGGELGARGAAAGAAALDAAAQVSLWSRTARAQVTLAAAGAARAGAAARGPWGRLRAEARAAGGGALLVAPDLDFYDKPALCVRVSTYDLHHEEEAALSSLVGRRAWAVRRGAGAAVTVPPRTLALGAPNDRVCAALA